MTGTTTRTTLATVLGNGDPGRAVPAAQEGLERTDVLRQPVSSAVKPGGGVTMRLVNSSVAEALSDQLDLDVGGLLLAGWLKHRELVHAGQETRDKPETQRHVVLVEHEVTASYRPSVEVLVNGTPTAALNFELNVALRLRGVVAVVERGRLTALRHGDLEAVARLLLNGIELASGSYPWQVGLVVQLGDGIALVGSPVTAAPSVPPPRTATVPSATSSSAQWWEHSEAQPSASPAGPWWQRSGETNA
jgi:hypothetical protein